MARLSHSLLLLKHFLNTLLLVSTHRLAKTYDMYQIHCVQATSSADAHVSSWHQQTGGSPPLSLPAVFMHLSSEPLSSFKTASSSQRPFCIIRISQSSVFGRILKPTCFYMGTHVLSHGSISSNTCVMHLSGKGKHLRVGTSSSEWWG